MPVVVSQTRRLNPYFNSLFPGGVEPDWLIGGISDYQKTELLVRVGQYVVSSGNAPITIDCPEGATQSEIGLFDGTWTDQGIGLDDSITVKILVQDKSAAASFLTNTYNVTVLGISSDKKKILVNAAIKNFNNDNVGSGAIFGSTPRQENFQEGYVRAWVVKDPEVTALEFEYNMLSNFDKDSNSMASIIEGSTNRFSINGIDPGTSAILDLVQEGYKSGGAIKWVKVEAIPNGGDPNGYYQSGDNVPDLDGSSTAYNVPLHLKESLFRVEIISMIWGLEQDIDNFDTNTPPEWFNDDNALTDNFTLRFYNNYTDTNSFLTNDLNNPSTQKNATTGWQGENYNGRPTPYTLVSTNHYNILGTPVSFIDFGNETKTDIVINNPNHSSSTRYGISIFHLPNELDQNLNSYLNNTFANTPIYYNDFSGTDSTGFFTQFGTYSTVNGFEGADGQRIDLSQIDVTDLGSYNIQISFRTTPNTQYFDYFDQQPEDDRRLLVLINVQDWDRQQDTNRATKIVGAYGEMIFNPIPIGEYPYMSNTFLELPLDPDTTGATELIGFVEDLWMAKTKFQIDLASGIVFNSIIPTVELINSVTGQVVELERVEIDLTSQPTDGTGIQQFNITQPGRFITSSTNDKNILQVQRIPLDDVPPFYHYEMRFPLRIRYEDWIENPNIPNDLVDILEANNGLNNDWYWLQQNNWELKLSVYSNVSRLGEPGLYKNVYPMLVKDYFQGLDAYQEYRAYDSLGNPLYQGVNSNGIDINAIKENELTTFEADTILNTGVYPASGIYAYVDIQVDQGSGYKSVRTLSTVYEGEPSDPLKPTGENLNLLYLVLVNPTTLRARFLVEESLLASGFEFRITKRIGCSTGNKLPILPDGSPYNEKYNNKYL